MEAAREGHTEVVRALLAAPGIDVNKADDNGWTAVMVAAREGHTEVVRALLAAPGIDVNKATKIGNTALDLAIRFPIKREVVVLLRASRCPVSPLNLVSCVFLYILPAWLLDCLPAWLISVVVENLAPSVISAMLGWALARVVWEGRKRFFPV